MMQLARLLIKGRYIFKNVIAASRAYRTFHSKGIAADWALIIGILLQNDRVVKSLKGSPYGVLLNNKKKSVTDITVEKKHRHALVLTLWR